MTSDPIDPTAFDHYAETYDQSLNEGISVSGENKKFFARARIAWLAKHLCRFNFQPEAVLDFGCGTGSATPFFLELLRPRNVVGVDQSPASLERARRDFGSSQVQFFLVDQQLSSGRMDLAFCNGVFHHIPLSERPAAVRYVYAALRPGGLFAFWENNPWNPGTRFVMSRIPFDRDAITLSPPEARRLLRSEGFQIVRTDFLFIFPKFLRWFRALEPLVSRLPLGAQYQVLCRKP